MSEMSDRAAEVYFGHTGGSWQRERLTARIDWALEQHKQGRVLDVGCSQGLLPLLLAREGFEVVGIDPDGKALAYAHRLIHAEPAAVRSNIEFVESDVVAFDPKMADFDTVYLCEVLEHVSNPEEVLLCTLRLLRGGGQLILSVPHGHLPHPDHEHEFGLSELLQLLPAYMAVESLTSTDGYIRLTAIKGSSHDNIRPAAEELEKLSTKALIQEQRYFHRILRRKNKAYEELQVAMSQLNLEREGETAKVNQLEQQISVLHVEHKKSYRRQKRFAAKLKKQIKDQAIELKKIKLSRRYRLANLLANLRKRPLRTSLNVAKKALGFLYRFLRGGERKSVSANLGIQFGARRVISTPAMPARSERIKVAAILDDFSTECLSHCWDLTLLSRKNWQSEIQARDHAMLFVESAWRGNNGEWSYTLTSNGAKNRLDLLELLAFCKDSNIPAVFWNKEDPPNFEVFKDAAILFDHIFTTDAACIPKYKELAEHKRVYALPFAAEPLVHNPVDRTQVPGKSVAFAGGWYGEKHSARAHFLPLLLDGAIDAVGDSLLILDRFSDEKDSSNHYFPEKYRHLIHPKVQYQQMPAVYRSFDVFLNVNSVTESTTMFSRRVFELLACGTCVVSSPSLAMSQMLPDLVDVAETPSASTKAVNRLLSNEVTRAKRAHVGYREVHLNHTYAARTHAVEKIVLGSSDAENLAPLVTVIAPTNRPDRLENLKQSYIAQRYVNKQLYLVLNSDDFVRSEVEEIFSDVNDVTIFELSESLNLPSCLNVVMPHVQGQYWAKMDDDDIYGPDYLSDSLLPFRFTEASVVGKASYFGAFERESEIYLRQGGKSHKYVSLVCGGTIVAKTADTQKLGFDETRARGSDTHFLKSVVAAGFKIYSADPFNFIQMRSINHERHTWTIEKEAYLRTASRYSDFDQLDEVIF